MSENPFALDTSLSPKPLWVGPAPPFTIASWVSGNLEVKLKVSLKDFPTTTGKAADWRKFWQKFVAVATANGHEDVLDKDFQVPSDTMPIAHGCFQAMNHVDCSALDHGTAGGTLRSKVNKHRSTRDGHSAFLEIDAHQKGQGSEETCATNAWDKLTALSLTPNFPGGCKSFLGK